MPMRWMHCPAQMRFLCQAVHPRHRLQPAWHCTRWYSRALGPWLYSGSGGLTPKPHTFFFRL